MELITEIMREEGVQNTPEGILVFALDWKFFFFQL